MSAREERAAEVCRLRDAGRTRREIMAELGMASSTLYSLLNDPDGSRLKARKDSYRGTCLECGKQTDGSAGASKAPTRCRDCITWTEAEIIAAMQEWAASHGGPPTVKDWQAAGPHHPAASGVTRRFNWNALLRAAGLEVRTDRCPETQAEVERLIASGLSAAEVADRFGWAPSNVTNRLRHHGTSIAELRKAA